MVMDWSSNALTSITFKFNHMIPIPRLISLSCALKYQSHITDLLSYTIFEKELHLESNENSHKEIRVKDWYEKKYEHVWYGPNNASLIAQKMKVSIKDFFSKLTISAGNIIFCAVRITRKEVVNNTLIFEGSVMFLI